VNLTRAFLRQPRVWLLDEPTASIDRHLEQQVTLALRQSVKAEDTLILVTHKAEMLELVDRVVVIADHHIVLDGPKAEVLKTLQHSIATPAHAA
jgi:ATP-binding cassette subfamily C protein LapB